MSALKRYAKHSLRIHIKLLALFIICSIFAPVFSSMNLAYGQTNLSYVSGYVVDEHNVALSGVKIQLISGGAISDSCTSNSRGYFYMRDVPYGTYTIQFSKSGYAKIANSVSIQSTNTNTGTITVLNAISLSTSTLRLIASPGDQVVIPFTVENFGDATEIVDFSSSNPNGWSTRILTDNYEVTKISLSSGQNLLLQLQVTIPLAASLDLEYNVSVNMIGTTNSSLTFSVLTRTPHVDINALNLHSSILSTVANSGEKLLLPFTVSNSGEETDFVEFSVSNPGGWTTKILDDNGREINYIALSPGTSSNFKLEIRIPMDYTGENSLTLTASGTTTSTLDFMLTVEPISESTIVSCRFPGKWALPGDVVAFQTQLTNPFGVDVRFSPLLDSVPSGWSASLKTADDEYVTEIILGADESVELVVEVESPASAVTGENYELLVAVKSNNQTVGTLPLVVSLQQPEAIDEIGISTKFPEVTVEAGRAFEYQLTLGNFGSSNRILFLAVEHPADWKAVIQSGTSEISQLNIGPASIAGFEELTVVVTPPSTVNLGTYNITVQAKSESGVVLADLELKATITGSYDLYLSMSTLLTSTTSGESTSCTATVTNRGYSTLSAIGLDCEAEDGWDIQLSPSQIDLLRPQESYSFDVVIETPKDTVSGDYLVTLTGLSDQVESNPMQVRVSVNTSTSWGLYGFGIAIIIIIALVLVFRKFKRR